MKINVSVPEIVRMVKEIVQPEQIFDLILSDIRRCMGSYSERQ